MKKKSWTPRELANHARRMKRVRVFHLAHEALPTVTKDSLSESERAIEKRLQEMKATSEEHRVMNALKQHSLGLRRFFAELSFENLAESACVAKESAVSAVQRFLEAGILTRRAP